MLTAFAFNVYMIFEAGDVYGWWGQNIIDETFKYIFDTLDSSIFINILLWPLHEILGVFLFLEDEKHFSAMHEFQAYYFVFITYPYIWLYSELFTWYHVSIAPSMLFWLVVDPNLLIKGYREDGTGIPRDNYAYIFAEVDSITSMMWGDLRYLY